MASVKRAASASSSPVGAPASVPLAGRASLGAAFRRLWWATGISASGDGLIAVAVPLLAVTVTRDPVLIAGLTAANRASAAVAALPGGLVADRWDRRSVMVVCNVAAGLALFALLGAMSLGWAVLEMLYVVAILLAACDVTYGLSVQASLPDVTPTDKLAVANGRLIAVEGAGEQFIGPASGGILFSLARQLPFFADSVSFLISAWLVRSALPRPPGHKMEASDGHDEARSNGLHPERTNGNGVNATAVSVDRPGAAGGRRRHRRRWATDFGQGLAVFRRERALQLLAAAVAVGALCQTMVLAILILYGEQTLHLTSTGYGFFFALAAAIGVLAAYFSGHMQHRFGSGQLVLMGLSLCIISYVGLAFTHSAVLAVFVFGLQEIGTVAANVGSVTARQRLIPRQLYGRVGSVHRLAVLSASVIGALLGGFIASASSVGTTMLTAGIVLLVAAVLIGPWLLPALKRSTSQIGEVKLEG